MTDTQRLSLELEPVEGAASRWTTPLSSWAGFRVIEVRDGFAGRTPPFTLEGSVIVCLHSEATRRPVALIEVETPNASIEAAKLALAQAQSKTEDHWRSRTYGFSIGSAVLTAVVTIAVAYIARPSHEGPSIDVDAVHSCRDSLQRLSTLTQIRDQSIEGLSSDIQTHVQTCDPVLEGLLIIAAKADAK